ncbi:Bug family tripartite tricarboxylate transporter substrate binding protein [Fodinicurvata halophila]|uniref:Bug family tripartite tricarboxylate transporter substrate binding protein n=1 Tax=Fodinicurvata halophila TaxID=1419723 RepID=A0ABV8UNI8_9PROT
MRRAFMATAAAIFMAAPAAAQEGSWQPEEPVTIIVPWSAGGSTDSVTRVLASELEEALDQTVVVTNQPGASGSVGTTNAWEADRDGLTWTAGAAVDLGSYPVLGMLDVPIEEWRLYLHIANVAVVGANPDAGYENFGDLIDAMEENPGEITVATAGTTSGGHNAMEAIAQAAGVEYRHATYDGGNPAVLSTVSGETDITTQLASEQAEMIRGGRIEPLAVLADTPLEIEGYGEIPPVTEWIPDIVTANNYFGIWAPKDIPENVKATMDEIWENQIANSEELQEYAAQNGAIFDPSYGEEAQEKARPILRQNAWLLYDANKAENNPEEFGIERPE